MSYTITLRQYCTPKNNMSTPTIIGTETEFGVSVKNAKKQDPIAASTLVVNAYRNRTMPTISWDYAQESPLMDARGFIDESQKPIVEKNTYSVINDILVNGGRYYVDHAHPEYCTPECSNARDLVKYEKAGELILDLSRLAAEQLLLDNQEIIIYKNNTDYKGHSYGSHENYLMSRKIDFSDIVDGLTPFIVTRQIIAGSGKVGTENGADETDFQISQRADFFEKEVGLSTMVERPIINTRDEPHADSTRYRRLHVIVGDSNMSEFTIYLKVGITAIALQLIEKRVIRDQFTLNEPVAAIKAVSRDLMCNQKIELKDGRNLTAIEIQRAYLNLAQKYLSDDEKTPIVDDVMQKWDFVLNRLQKNPMSLGRHLDWIIKKKLIDAYIARHRFKWTDPQVRMLDLQYHDLRPDKGLYLRLQKNGHVERILTHEEVVHAIQHPPLDTRAYFRGTCLRRFTSHIHSVSWNSIIFNGPSGFEKIMMERPHFGTQEIVGEMLNKCTVDELVNQIRDNCK